jgi:hypothetical protein
MDRKSLFREEIFKLRWENPTMENKRIAQIVGCSEASVSRILAGSEAPDDRYYSAIEKLMSTCKDRDINFRDTLIKMIDRWADGLDQSFTDGGGI